MTHTPQFFDIVFDGPPSHESGRFVEVENDDGKSIEFGTWFKRDDGYWVLRFENPLAERDWLREVNAELVEALNAVVSAYESPPHGLNWMEAVAINMKNVRAAIAKAEGREK